jgi:uncharacterized membrane protein
MDFGGFIGRFHPLVVHLPIGFLMAAAVFEYYARKRRYQKLDTAVEITLFLGAIFAILACGSGWLLANRGAYIEQSLFLHRWLGIAVAALASVAWLVKTDRLSLSKSMLTGLMSLMIFGLFAAGHFGGNMTHGDDYLVEYAPGFLKNILGFGRDEEVSYKFGPPDSIKVYADLVQPVLKDQCWKCHQTDNALSGLDMSTKATFLKGGDNGKVLEVGSAYDSELFRRITLPVSDQKSMPPTGLALPYQTTRLIEWWIDAGASFDKSLAELDTPDDVKKLLGEKYGISFKVSRSIERIEVAAAGPAVIDAIRATGIQIMALSEISNLLEVTATNGPDLKSLDPIKEQITWLNLANAKLDDSQVKVIADFRHLTRLRLQGNPISDASLKALVDLSYLESLNLNGTNITDDAIQTLQQITSLRSVYLFETAVTEEAISELQNARPDLEVVQGFRFEAMDLK